MSNIQSDDLMKPASSFDLVGVDGMRHNIESSRGVKGLLVMFICNHCPYVKAVIERLCQDCRDLAEIGIGSVAIMSNDTATYPDDSFENMKKFSTRHQFPFPYLIDDSQQVARAYGAVCTPDFFGYGADLSLQYRGRLDPHSIDPPPKNRQRELFDAMLMVAQTGTGPALQRPSIGCSIKWRD